jgi:Tfp pilus assembly protein FimT
MSRSGITVIELLFVVSITGILALSVAYSYEGWATNYTVEGSIEELYSDLMNARTRAMTRSRAHFVTLDANGYTIQEDISPWPDGDGDLTDEDTVRPAGYPDPIPLLSKQITSTHQFQLISRGKLPLVITVNQRGLMSPGTAPVSFGIKHTASPDYDCIMIRQSRIRLGKQNGATCQNK